MIKSLSFKHFVEQLKLPEDISLNLGVAKLGKDFGFDIDDVRKLVEEYKLKDQ